MVIAPSLDRDFPRRTVPTYTQRDTHRYHAAHNPHNPVRSAMVWQRTETEGTHGNLIDGQRNICESGRRTCSDLAHIARQPILHRAHETTVSEVPIPALHLATGPLNTARAVWFRANRAQKHRAADLPNRRKERTL